VGEFLNHLEKDRGIVPRSRNLRLSAIRSFFRYAAFQQPDHSALIQRVLSIPSKRYDRPQIAFLSRPEIDALLAAPDTGTWSGRRDHALLLLAVQTGLRVSELTGLRCEDIRLGAGAHVLCRGKGRKERCTPLTKQGTRVFKAWLRERNGAPSDAIFLNARGGPLSSDGVEYILSKHVSAARKTCPTLARKRVSPHYARAPDALLGIIRGAG
jgi:site-specific recombinase XerD